MLQRRIAAVAALLAIMVLAMGASPARAQTEDIPALVAEATRLYQAGRYAEAITQARRALAAGEKAFDPGHVNIGALNATLGETYRAAGRLREAEQHLKRSLPILQKLVGAEAVNYAMASNNLAQVYLAQGRFAEAEPLFRRALSIFQKELGAGHQNVGVATSGLAETYRGLQRAKEAEPLYRRAVTILEKAQGAPPALLGLALNNLAVFYIEQGRLAEAEAPMKRGLAIREKALGPRHPDVAQSLSNLAELYRRRGLFAEVEPLLKRAVSIGEATLGAGHPSLAMLLNNFAGLQVSLGRKPAAAQLFKRSLAILEKALPPDHRDIVLVLDNLVELSLQTGQYAEGQRYLERQMAIEEKRLGTRHADMAIHHNKRGQLAMQQGRLDEAETSFRQALATSQAAEGADGFGVASALNNLALLYNSQGRFAEAEPNLRRAMVIIDRTGDADDAVTGKMANNLALSFTLQGRYGEAEPLFKLALARREKALGANHTDIGQTLNNLSQLYRNQGRLEEAERLARRAVAVYEAALGAEHPDLGQALSSLATIEQEQRRLAAAEPLHKRALAIRERALGPGHPDVAETLSNMALLHVAERRFAEAEPLQQRALAILEKALGAEHPAVAMVLNNLAATHLGQERDSDAERLFRRSLEIRLKALGPDHPGVMESLSNLAFRAQLRGDAAQAVELFARTTDLVKRRLARGLAGTEVSTPGEVSVLALQFIGLVKASHGAASGSAAGLAREAAATFETAQWAMGSPAAASLAQMAARNTRGSPQLAALVRERQDLVAEWQAKDRQLLLARGAPASERQAAPEQALADRLTAIDGELGRIDRRLDAEFPDWGAHSKATPIPVAEVQAVLRDDEALVLFLVSDDRFKPLPEETFVWVVTKSALRWVRSPLGTDGLRREVGALRCGLDTSAWQADGANGCRALLGLAADAPAPAPAALPFDLARAHGLYASLLGEVDELIRGKHLLLVPSGPLTALPFQALVTAAPAAGEQPAKAAWLGLRQPISVLPAVSSIQSLRRHARASAASEPFIGFGNPLLLGRDGTDRRAWGRQACAEQKSDKVAQPAASAPPVRLASLFRGGLASVDDVRRQDPLPETADELCAVARMQGLVAPDEMVVLGERATETHLKQMSDDGRLARARVLHFATHGLVAGETAALARDRAEPALVLTPPEEATARDDGLLTASEVAALRLDADWVVLSACNTAAGDKAEGDALSGLARAFFYAGARALLVSHWYVDSQATVALITKAFETLRADPAVGRAEAMRRSMAALIGGGGRQAHPAVWAPFVVVGEGAAERR